MKRITKEAAVFAAKLKNPHDPIADLKKRLAPLRAWNDVESQTPARRALSKNDPNIPDHKTCNEARAAILSSANAILEAKRERKLSQAIKILDDKRPNAKVGNLLKLITEKLKQKEGWMHRPKLEMICADLYESEQLKLKKDAHVKLKSEFLDAVKSYQMRALSGKLTPDAQSAPGRVT